MTSINAEEAALTTSREYAIQAAKALNDAAAAGLVDGSCFPVWFRPKEGEDWTGHAAELIARLVASDRDRLAWRSVAALEPAICYVIGDLRRLQWTEREIAAMQKATECHLEALAAKVNRVRGAPVPPPEPVFLAARQVRR